MASFSQSFYDSDDEAGYEDDILNNDFIREKVQEDTNIDINRLMTFLKNPELIVKKGDPKCNIYNLKVKDTNDTKDEGNYDIPGNKIHKFFDRLEVIRRTNPIGFKWVERQYFEGNTHSGIMIDLDIYQEMPVSQFNHKHSYNLLLQHIVNVIQTYFNIEKVHGENSITLHIVILKRPKITRISENGPYKDGLHILLPGFQIRKDAKKLFMDKLCETKTEFFNTIKVVKKPTSADEPLIPTDARECIDKNSAVVPVFLYGCERNDDRQPYVLDRFIEVDLGKMNGKFTPPSFTNIEQNYTFHNGDEGEINKKPKSVWIQEFSLNWEVATGARTNPIIKKFHYEVLPEYQHELGKIKEKMEESNIDYETYGELDMRRIYDVETEFYKGLLDTLNQERSDKYESWFAVLCVLAHLKKGDYKVLAKYFSQKSKKYNLPDFERYWELAKCKSSNILNIGSLCLWAKQDNPARYKEVQERNIHSNLLKMLYEKYAEGILGHYDIAKLMHKCLEFKYVWEPNMNAWFECVTEEDDCKEGEKFKWRLVSGQPSNMRNFISEIMPRMFSQSLVTITNWYKKATRPEETQYHFNIMRNLKATCRKLKDCTFKTSVIRDAQCLFEDNKFIDELDKDAKILPVANGILVLGERVKLIEGYHNYKVSKYAPTKYVPFNPRDEMQKKILKIYRNLFPDEEPDSHEFFMSLYASSLDAQEKEHMFCMKIGAGRNGKTMTTELHRKMMGSIFATTMAIQFITGKQNRDAESSTPASMSLEYARQVDFQEPEKSETLSSSKTKLLTGGGQLPCRQNYGDQRQIQIRCNFVLDTNYDLKINDNTLAMWQRIQVIKMAMRFHTPNMMQDYDPTNPYHRIAIDLKDMKNDPKFVSAYLAVLVFYYEQLQIKYGGSVLRIPHPHIEQRTKEYRNRQNKLSSFYTKHLVKCNEEEKDTKLLVNDIKDRYLRYYSTVGLVTNEFKENVDFDINSSIIANLIQQDKYGPDYIMGYRLLEHNGEDELKEGESHFEDKSSKYTKKISIQPESWEQYYERICRIYDESQQDYITEIRTGQAPPPRAPLYGNSRPLVDTKEVNMSALRSDIDEILSPNKMTELIEFDTNKPPPRANNVKIPKKIKKQNFVKVPKSALRKQVESSDEEEDESDCQVSDSEEESD